MRLALMLSALFALSAVVAGAVAYAAMSEELRARLFDEARREAVALAAELRAGGPEELSRRIAALGAVRADHSTLYLFAPAGSGRPVGAMTLAEPFEGARLLVGGRDLVIPTDPDEHEGETWFAFGLRTPQGRIVVARDSQWIADSQEVLVQSVAWGLAAALLATIALAFAIGRRAARRTARLNRVLARVGDGDLAARCRDEDGPRDDIGELARGIDAMLERLSANVERLAQVSADVAHDLRSPLTRLRLRLEPHALRGDLPDDARAAIAASLVSLDQVSASFDAILQLSQMETGGMTVEAAPLDLADIARQAHEMLAPVAEEMGHRLSLDAPDAPVPIAGNGELISQALINLVENAMRHAPPPADIVIRVARDGADRVLTVTDDGPGIPAEEREKVTRRFYRLDRSRNRPGTGLGLSLASAIARLHGARLTLADNAPGLRVGIVFAGPEPGAAGAPR